MARSTSSRRRRRSPARTTRAASAARSCPPEAAAGERVWVLDVPYGYRPPGVRWYPNPGVNAYIGADLPAVLAEYASRPYTRLRRLEDSLNDSPGPPLQVRRRVPRPMQKQMAAELESALTAWGTAVLTAATGTGKTFAAVWAARRFLQDRPNAKILVVVDRPSLVTTSSWAGVIAGLGDGGMQWLIMPPEAKSLRKLLGPRGARQERFDLVIADEVQNFRHESDRTKALRALIGFGKSDQSPLLAITATLGHNPAEYLLLAPLLARLHHEQFGQWRDLGARLIAAGHPLEPSRFRAGAYCWSERALADPLLQQRSVEQVQSTLSGASPPALVFRDAPWGPAPVRAVGVALTADQRRQYEAQWRQFRRENQIARTGGDSEAGRAALLRFRQKASFLRVQHTVELAVSQARKGRQVVVAVELVTAAADPLAAMIEEAGIGCARIYGDHDAKAERLAFQLGHKPVCVVSKTTAISLHAGEELDDGRVATSAPRVGLMHQPRYSGIAAQQTIGRTHRDGQTSPWFLLYAQDTVEEEASRVMVERSLTATASGGASTAMWESVAGMFGVSWLSAADGDIE